MILVTGATGFLGQAVCAELERQHIPYLGLPGRRQGGDLRNTSSMLDLSSAARSEQGPATVIHLAYPGSDGIGTMLETPADFVSDMLRIDLNVIEACARAKVPRLVCVGSVCAYPQHVDLPATEDQLWAGYPEPVNAPYGIGKRMQLELLKVYARQFQLNYMHLILGNLYGPGDHSGHVIPATIRKVLAAKQTGAEAVEVWGDGTATREFLHVQDAARAIVTAARWEVDLPGPINICTGEEIAIRTMVRRVMEAVRYEGRITWNPERPNGQTRRWFSSRRAERYLHWTAQIPFPEGIKQTVKAWQGEYV